MNGNDESCYKQSQLSCEADGKTWYVLNLPPNVTTKPEVIQHVYLHENERKAELLTPNLSECAEVQIPSEIVEHHTKKNQKILKRPRTDMVVANSKQMFQNVDALADGRFYCRICERAYKTNTTMIAHLRGRHLRCDSECTEPGCNFVAKTNYESRKHQRVHEKQLAKVLKQNSKKSKEVVDDIYHSENPINLTFPCEEELKTEIMKSPASIPGMEKTLDTAKKGKVLFTCLECSQSFQNSYQARRHREFHLNEPKQCYYCDEIRRGDIELREHYMKNHRFEGIRTFTCAGCEKEYTSIELFNEHIKTNPDAFPCRALKMRQDIYYGELPSGIMVDEITQKRIDMFRYHHLLRESRTRNRKFELAQQVPFNKKRRVEPSIFDGFSLIQTEMGLKTVGDVMKSTPRSRPPRISISDSGSIDSIEEELLVDSPEQPIYYVSAERSNQETTIPVSYSNYPNVNNSHMVGWSNQNMTEYGINDHALRDSDDPRTSGIHSDRGLITGKCEQSSVYDKQFRRQHPNGMMMGSLHIDTHDNADSCQTPSNFDKDPMMGFDLQCYNITDVSKFNEKQDENFDCSIPSTSTMFVNSPNGRDEIFEELNKLDYVLPSSSNTGDNDEEDEGFDQLFKLI